MKRHKPELLRRAGFGQTEERQLSPGGQEPRLSTENKHSSI